MNINLSDQIVSQFISGLITVFALVGVGGLVATALYGIARRFPFIHMSLVLALSPLALVQFFDYGGDGIFFIYAMVVIVLGFTIDGTQYLLTPKVRPKAEAEMPREENREEEKENPANPRPGVIVWEKAK